MANTTSISNGMTFESYAAPGNGLTIEVCLNAHLIKIIPGRRSGRTQVSKYTYTSEATEYEFTPEEYKDFWKALKEEKGDDLEYMERMRVALTYALNKYQRKYGKIFA